MSLHPSTVKYLKEHKSKYSVIGERTCYKNGKEYKVKIYDSISDEVKNFISSRGDSINKPNMSQFTYSGE